MPAPGEAEAGPPAEGLAEIAAQHRGPEGAEVDAVIVEGEARIAARIAVRIELADDRGNVRLQEADAHDDQRNRQEEDVHVGELRGSASSRSARRKARRQGEALRHVLDLDAAAFSPAPKA
jgi:hypothetical protein